MPSTIAFEKKSLYFCIFSGFLLKKTYFCIFIEIAEICSASEEDVAIHKIRKSRRFLSIFSILLNLSDVEPKNLKAKNLSSLWKKILLRYLKVVQQLPSTKDIVWRISGGVSLLNKKQLEKIHRFLGLEVVFLSIIFNIFR